MKNTMPSASHNLLGKSHSKGYRLILSLCCVMMFCMLSQGLQAEEGFVVNVNITAEFYGTLFEGYARPQSIYTCSDDAVVVLSIAEFGDVAISEWPKIGSIVKVDAYGNLLWQRTFRPPTGTGPDIFDWIAGIGIDENDTVSFIIGRWDNSYQKFLVEVDENGMINSIPLNLNISDNTARVTFNKALRCPSGDFIAVGNIRTNTMTQKNLAYFRFSPNGQVLASTFIPPDSTWFSISDIYDAEIEENGNLLLGCRINPYHNDLLRLNMDDSIVERIPLQGIFSYINSSAPVSLAHSPGSEHSIVAYTDGSIDYLARVTAGGISYQVLSDVILVSSMIEIGNDAYVVAYNPPIGPWLSLIRLNYTDIYELVWAWNDPDWWFNEDYGHSLSHHLLTSSHNNSIYIAGHYNSLLGIAKILPNGQLPVEDELQTPSVKKITGYPNPMKDYINLKLGQDSQLNYASNALEIYNIRGQLLAKIRTAKDGFVTWDGKDNLGRSCPNGVYLIKDSLGLYKMTKIIKAE